MADSSNGPLSFLNTPVVSYGLIVLALVYATVIAPNGKILKKPAADLYSGDGWLSILFLLTAFLLISFAVIGSFSLFDTDKAAASRSFVIAMLAFAGILISMQTSNMHDFAPMMAPMPPMPPVDLTKASGKNGAPAMNGNGAPAMNGNGAPAMNGNGAPAARTAAMNGGNGAPDMNGGMPRATAGITDMPGMSGAAVMGRPAAGMDYSMLDESEEDNYQPRMGRPDAGIDFSMLDESEEDNYQPRMGASEGCPSSMYSADYIKDNQNTNAVKGWDVINTPAGRGAAGYPASA